MLAPGLLIPTVMVLVVWIMPGPLLGSSGNWSILMRILLLTVSGFLRLSRGSRGGLQSRWNKKKPLRADDFVRLLSSVTGGNLWSVSLTSLRFAAQLSVLYCTFARYEEVAALTVEQILVEAGDGDVVVMYARGKQYQNNGTN